MDDPNCFVTCFRFGSVVFLNVPPNDVEQIVQVVKKYAIEPVLNGFERREIFGVLLDIEDLNSNSSSSNTDMILNDADDAVEIPPPPPPPPPPLPPVVVTGDYCIVPELDMNAVVVISNIMGQTVALDSYNDTVDDLLAQFAKINTNVTRTGNLTGTDKHVLFKTVAQNNSIFIDMISKIRIKDRSDTAWNLTKYERVHYGLKSEFEIDERFDMIEFKLSLIQDNAKFFLEVLQSQKSNNLEWIIVFLITVECFLMCVEMSGFSESLVQHVIQLSEIFPT
jgi:uncharacterized Rmd1/YagE family protein